MRREFGFMLQSDVEWERQLRRRIHGNTPSTDLVVVDSLGSVELTHALEDRLPEEVSEALRHTTAPDKVSALFREKLDGAEPNRMTLSKLAEEVRALLLAGLNSSSLPVIRIDSDESAGRTRSEGEQMPKRNSSA